MVAYSYSLLAKPQLANGRSRLVLQGSLQHFDRRPGPTTGYRHQKIAAFVQTSTMSKASIEEPCMSLLHVSLLIKRAILLHTPYSGLLYIHNGLIGCPFGSWDSRVDGVFRPGVRARCIVLSRHAQGTLSLLKDLFLSGRLHRKLNVWHCQSSCLSIIPLAFSSPDGSRRSNFPIPQASANFGLELIGRRGYGASMPSSD
ncbi:hypothetical protein BCR34DRAFT_327141 [Clohesyomyces aquaticus]|uniref:Uncharacterized protein n=1 Tax=Clohesyomyces aquaticus TaxID=1231657 RepID=A0A1Y1ZMR5_9PLEO|nr:hypothetical protein BCR34DRAFT_327141 [Clohesyomyces aquaticus]